MDQKDLDQLTEWHNKYFTIPSKEPNRLVNYFVILEDGSTYFEHNSACFSFGLGAYNCHANGKKIKTLCFMICNKHLISDVTNHMNLSPAIDPKFIEWVLGPDSPYADVTAQVKHEIIEVEGYKYFILHSPTVASRDVTGLLLLLRHAWEFPPHVIQAFHTLHKALPGPVAYALAKRATENFSTEYILNPMDTMGTNHGAVVNSGCNILAFAAKNRLPVSLGSNANKPFDQHPFSLAQTQGLYKHTPYGLPSKHSKLSDFHISFAGAIDKAKSWASEEEMLTELSAAWQKFSEKNAKDATWQE